MTSKAPWEHDHVFGQNARRPGEVRTRLVLAVTIITMVVEIIAGFAFGSMALLADGVHMAGHAAVLGVSALAYFAARRYAGDERLSFGTGKLNALGGYTGAILLVAFSAFMVFESIGRLIDPQPILFNAALIVAVVGLIVNGASAFILHPPGAKRHAADHGCGRDLIAPVEPPHGAPAGAGEDHTLQSAYLHVMADALTSVLAIVALVAGKYFGAAWLDPIMGLVGAAIIIVWAKGLLKSSGGVLLDLQAEWRLRERARKAIEGSGDARVEDLHVWAIGPGIYAAEVSLCASAPAAPDVYKARLPDDLNIVHVTLETHCKAARDVKNAAE